MFQFLQNAFLYIQDILNSVIEFFKGFINGLVHLFQLFPKITSLTTHAIGAVPSIFAVFITLTVSITIIYIIVGRNVGDSS